MPDALRLNDPVQLTGRKRRPGYDTDPPEFDSASQATTLRGILAGIEIGTPGFVPPAPAEPSDAAEALEPEDLGSIVLKVTGKAPFQTSGLGGWDHKLVPIALAANANLFVMSDADSRAFFATLVDEYEAGDFERPAAWRAALENIAGVELYDRADRITPGTPTPDDGGVVDVDILLWPTSLLSQGAEKKGRERVASVAELVKRSEDERVLILSRDDRRPDTLIIRARLDQETLDLVLDDPLVEQVRGPLTADLVAEDLASGRPPEDDFVPVGTPIGIIDDLVHDNNPWMDGVVTARAEFAPESGFSDATTHGTQVASIAAWGDVGQLMNGVPHRDPHPIYAVRVAHADNDGKPFVAGDPAQQIEKAMRWLHDQGVRVAVFPYADRFADQGALPSAVASIIDLLAAELNMVVVVSAGNLTDLPDGVHWFHDYPSYLADDFARVASPGTAALAVTVGSTAHSNALDPTQFPGGRGIADVGQASPFGRTGPVQSSSAAGRQKPEFSGPGGNWGWDATSGLVVERDPGLTPVTLRPAAGGRLFSNAWGTSYAAPRVAHEIADIADQYPEASANLLRALTALSGTPPRQLLNPQVGTYGTPVAARVAESTADHAICVLEGEILTNSYQLVRLPIPAEFSVGRWDREVRVSLAYDPPVRRSRRDYIAGHMRFDLVRNYSEAQLQQIYREQPTRAEREAGQASFDRPGNRNLPDMKPVVTALGSDTLICRSVRSEGAWDADDSDFYLVLEHTQSQWSGSQKAEYDKQRYALAVELIRHERNDLDLHALTEAQLRVEGRGRVR